MSKNNFQRPSLTEVAYEEIQKSIYQGDFSPGHKLVIEDLVQAYKISGTPIKEALNRLVAEGLVEAVPRKGMQVKKLISKDVLEIYDMRIMYELYCAEKAIKVIGQRVDITARLLAIIDDFEKIMANQVSYNYTAYIELDREFHLIIVSLCENEMLIREYKKINAIDMAFNSYIYRKLLLKRRGDILDEHKAIYLALIGGDFNQLADAIKTHIGSIKKHMMDFVNNDLAAQSRKISTSAGINVENV